MYSRKQDIVQAHDDNSSQVIRAYLHTHIVFVISIFL